ncbi:hypothetical protein NDU88_005373 [Pleurodeles waltl]|uniref:Uncharacterized protein n=1 Tax=Pleurodeles waltl TaxID=8319 RepID=A0AAV7W7M5_PLEWA|nr:hypothetical protein NDU88_005373 [Pleurodeles waltl]
MPPNGNGAGSGRECRKPARYRSDTDDEEFSAECTKRRIVGNQGEDDGPELDKDLQKLLRREEELVAHRGNDRDADSRKRNCGTQKRRKAASQGREARDEEKEESGIVGEETSHHRSEEDKEEAGGRTNFTVATGGRARNPATLLEKCGTIRLGLLNKCENELESE